MLKEKIMSVKLFSKIMWDRLNKKLWPEKKIVITPKHVENYLKEKQKKLTLANYGYKFFLILLNISFILSYSFILKSLKSFNFSKLY